MEKRAVLLRMLEVQLVEATNASQQHTVVKLAHVLTGLLDHSRVRWRGILRRRHGIRHRDGSLGQVGELDGGPGLLSPHEQGWNLPPRDAEGRRGAERARVSTMYKAVEPRPMSPGGEGVSMSRGDQLRRAMDGGSSRTVVWPQHHGWLRCESCSFPLPPALLFRPVSDRRNPRLGLVGGYHGWEAGYTMAPGE